MIKAPSSLQLTAEANLFDALQLVPAYHRDAARRQDTSGPAVRHEFQLSPA